jgi:hypothetical protein
MEPIVKVKCFAISFLLNRYVGIIMYKESFGDSRILRCHNRRYRTEDEIAALILEAANKPQMRITRIMYQTFLSSLTNIHGLLPSFKGRRYFQFDYSLTFFEFEYSLTLLFSCRQLRSTSPCNVCHNIDCYPHTKARLGVSIAPRHNAA